MRRFLVAFCTLAVILGLTTSAAVAASPHFKGRNGIPQCSDQGTVLVCSGALAGLGNEDVAFILDADALGTFACVNPAGHESPGQNKVPFEVGSTTIVDADDIKNGTLAFSVSAPLTPPTATAEEAGCPNPNWSTRLVDLEFSNVSLVIQQPVGTTIFTCTGGPNGQLSCS